MYSPSWCKNPSYLCGPSINPSQGRRYSTENGKLCKLGWTYRQGTVFAQRQYLYEKEATSMERPEMYFLGRCKNPTYLCGPGCQSTPSQWRRYRAENGNLRKLGWTCRHGAVFAPRQYLYEKEATGMERLEMYFPSRWKNPTYMWEPPNHPVSREAE